MRVTGAKLQKLFGIGDVLPTGGDRSTFKVMEIKSDGMRIQPHRGRPFRLDLEKLNAVLTDVRRIKERIAQGEGIERAIGWALRRAKLGSPKEVYLWGVVRAIETKAYRQKRDQLGAEPSALEGLRTETVIYSRGRNRRLRDRALFNSKGVCEACLVNYSAILDGKGVRALQVHHRKQLAASDRPRLTKLDDLAVVCATCHVLIHMDPSRAMRVEVLRRLLKRKGPNKTMEPTPFAAKPLGFPRRAKSARLGAAHR